MRAQAGAYKRAASAPHDSWLTCLAGMLCACFAELRVCVRACAHVMLMLTCTCVRSLGHEGWGLHHSLCFCLCAPCFHHAILSEYPARVLYAFLTVRRPDVSAAATGRASLEAAGGEAPGLVPTAAAAAAAGVPAGAPLLPGVAEAGSLLAQLPT